MRSTYRYNAIIVVDDNEPQFYGVQSFGRKLTWPERFGCGVAFGALYYWLYIGGPVWAALLLGVFAAVWQLVEWRAEPLFPSERRWHILWTVAGLIAWVFLGLSVREGHHERIERQATIAELDRNLIQRDHE